MGLDPLKKLQIQKRPMMDHMVRNDQQMVKVNKKLAEAIQDRKVDTTEAQNLGLDGSREYDLSKGEDIKALAQDLEAIKSNTKKPESMEASNEKPSQGLQNPKDSAE